MPSQESEARRKQRTRQLKRQQKQPARVQKRTGPVKGPVTPGVKAGIPKGLAALAREKRKKQKSPYLTHIRALHERINPPLIKRKGASKFKDVE